MEIQFYTFWSIFILKKRKHIIDQTVGMRGEGGDGLESWSLGNYPFFYLEKFYTKKTFNCFGLKHVSDDSESNKKRFSSHIKNGLKKSLKVFPTEKSLFFHVFRAGNATMTVYRAADVTQLGHLYRPSQAGEASEAAHMHSPGIKT